MKPYEIYKQLDELLEKYPSSEVSKVAKRFTQLNITPTQVAKSWNVIVNTLGTNIVMGKLTYLEIEKFLKGVK